MTLQLIVLAVVAAVSFAGGWKVDDWKNSAARLGEVKAAQAVAAAETRRADDISERFEARLASIRVVNRTFNNEVKHEVERTVYGDPNCGVPESGRLLRDRAIATANGSGEPPPALPAGPAKPAAADPRRAVPSGFGPNRPVWGVPGPAPGVN